MYDYQRQLREIAREVLAGHSFTDLAVVKGTGGARIEATLKGERRLLLVRTSSDRYLLWMRDEEGALKGIDDGDLIVVAALDNPFKPAAVDVYAFEPSVVREALQSNIAAHKAEGRGGTGPVYVCLDPIEGDKPKAVGSGLSGRALWTASVALGDGKPIDDEIDEAKTRAVEQATPDHGKMDIEGFLTSVKAELAARLNVPAKSISLELRLQV